MIPRASALPDGSSDCHRAEKVSSAIRFLDERLPSMNPKKQEREDSLDLPFHDGFQRIRLACLKPSAIHY
jgi:hypothetical protein